MFRKTSAAAKRKETVLWDAERKKLKGLNREGVKKSELKLQ